MSQHVRRIMRQQSAPKYKSGSFSYSQSIAPSESQAVRISALEYTSFSQVHNDNPIFFDVEWPMIENTLKAVASGEKTCYISTSKMKVESLCNVPDNISSITESLKPVLETQCNTFASNIKACSDFSSFYSYLNKHKRSLYIMRSILQGWERSDAQNCSLEDLFYNISTEILKNDKEFDEKISNLVSTAFTESRKKGKMYNREFVTVIKIMNRLEKSEIILAALCREEAIYYSSNPIDTGSGPLIFVMNSKNAVKNEIEHVSPFPAAVSKKLLKIARMKIYGDYLMFSMQRVIETIFIEKPSFIGLLRELCEDSEDDKLISNLMEHAESAIKDRVSMLLARSQGSAVSQMIELLEMLRNNRDELGSIYPLALKQFRAIINQSTFQTSFMIAKYINNKVIEDPGNFIMHKERIMELTQMLESYDALIEYHRRFLGQRLISRATEFDVETGILRELNQFTKFGVLDPLYSMLSDTKLTQTYNEEFDAGASFPFTVFIISANNWPQYPFVSPVVPQEVLDIRQRFLDFYKAKEGAKRSLRWIDSLESCTFTYKNVTLKAATLQFIVFTAVLTNKGNNNDLKEKTGIPSRHLIEILNQLMKVGLITKNRGKYVVGTLKATKSNIKLPPLSMIAAKQKKERSLEDIFEGRKESIKASIICSLKKLGELSFDALFEETKNSFKYPLSKNDFTNFIDELISYDVIVKGTNGKYRFCA